MAYVEVDAGPIEYVDTGGDGPPIVLLHGVPMTPQTQWAHVLPHLRGHRVVMPTLPMGGHRRPVRPGTDLSQFGMAAILGQFLEAAALDEVVLVLNDWGGGQFLLTEGLPGHERVGALALVACEAFDNFPPAPARALAAVAKVPGGIWLTVQAMRLRPVRQARSGYGGMSRRGIPDDVLREWFAPARADAGIRRDFAAFAAGAPPSAVLLAAAARLAEVDLPTLVVWAAHDTMMPLAHGQRLADLLPRARLVVAGESATLVPFDEPELLAGLLIDLTNAVRHSGHR